MFRKGDLRALAARLYWHEGDARRVVEAWRKSGDPVSMFADRLGVDPRRISRWASRLEKSEAATLRFHPVRVAGDDMVRGDACIDIQVGHGRHVRVAPGFATEDLRRVLAVLEERTPC